jgi:hypothetical protein
MNDHIPDLTKMIGDTPISDSTPHNVADLGMLCRQLERKLNAANDRIKRLEDALHRIANTDYRGNRSTESQIAFQALTEAKP